MPEILKHGKNSLLDKIYTCGCGCQWRYKEDDMLKPSEILACPECGNKEAILSQQLYPFPAPNYLPGTPAPIRWDVKPWPKSPLIPSRYWGKLPNEVPLASGNIFGDGGIIR